jgi:nicotinic acid mononucleotide adenylyltransferase
MTRLVAKLHASKWQGVFYITGGGTSLISELLEVPGASATVLEATVPYAHTSLASLLGQSPEQAVANSTARSLAMVAYQRAKVLSPQADMQFGFGASASLVSNRLKKGQTRAHWAIQSRTFSHAFSLILQAHLSRQAQEQKLTEAFYHSIEWALLQTAGDWEIIEVRKDSLIAPEPWQKLLDTEAYTVCTGNSEGKLLLPGSFNPIHQGHEEMLRVAETVIGLPGAFELTLRNADKPDIDFLTLSERLANITSHDVWLTNLTNFAEKAQNFPGTTFALGTDTVSRIGQIKFYNNSDNLRDQAIEDLINLNVRFLVFGRLEEGRFMTLEDLKLPQRLASICQAVPEDLYRNDISSSAIRSARKNEP